MLCIPDALRRLWTLSSEVPSTPVVEAQEACPSRLRSLRWSNLLWVDSKTWGHLLRWTVAPLLRWRGTTWLPRRRSVDQAVLGWSTPSRPRQRHLLPLLLNTSMTSVLLLNGGTHKLIQGATLKQHQVLPKHGTGPLSEHHHLLLVGVGVVGVVLREVVKPLAVLIDTP
jgi:hypothetical protein